jgi:hypothetical protein
MKQKIIPHMIKTGLLASALIMPSCKSKNVALVSDDYALPAGVSVQTRPFKFSMQAMPFRFSSEALVHEEDYELRRLPPPKPEPVFRLPPVQEHFEYEIDYTTGEITRFPETLDSYERQHIEMNPDLIPHVPQYKGSQFKEKKQFIIPQLKKSKIELIVEGFEKNGMTYDLSRYGFDYTPFYKKYLDETVGGKTWDLVLVGYVNPTDRPSLAVVCGGSTKKVFGIPTGYEVFGYLDGDDENDADGIADYAFSRSFKLSDVPYFLTALATKNFDRVIQKYKKKIRSVTEYEKQEFDRMVYRSTGAE